jgi:ABC-type transporter Mla maintaining outer membrane lipid asymmetry permease subunit MlaE
MSAALGSGGGVATRPSGVETLMAVARRSWLLSALRKLGAVALFFLQLLGQCAPALARPRLVVQQIYNSGARSLIIIMLSGLFVGMVLGLQGYDLLQRFGSESALGVAAAIGLIKELGPVITALLFAGRAGTALASEIGLMAATPCRCWSPFSIASASTARSSWA